jgi:hypothetical protein
MNALVCCQTLLNVVCPPLHTHWILCQKCLRDSVPSSAAMHETKYPVDVMQKRSPGVVRDSGRGEDRSPGRGIGRLGRAPPAAPQKFSAKRSRQPRLIMSDERQLREPTAVGRALPDEPGRLSGCASARGVARKLTAFCRVLLDSPPTRLVQEAHSRRRMRGFPLRGHDVVKSGEQFKRSGMAEGRLTEATTQRRPRALRGGTR